MKKSMVFSFLLGGLLGCQSNMQDNKLPVWNVLETLQNTENKELAEMTSDLYRVPLETKEAILIKEIQKIIASDSLFFIKHSNRCSVFDAKGRYKGDIGSKGEGPHQYRTLTDFFILDGKVCLYEATKEIVRVYSPEGEFVRDFPTGESYNAVYPLENELFFGYMDNVSGTELLKIGFFNEKQLIDTIPYTQQFEHKGVYWSFPNEGQVYAGGGNYSFKELFNDTIYRILPERVLKPIYVVDLGAYRPAPEVRHSISNIMENIWDKIGRVTMIGETDTKLFFNVFLKKKHHAFYWDKQAAQLHAVHMAYPEAWQVDGPFIPQALSTDGSRLIGYVKSDTDENPVLVVAAL